MTEISVVEDHQQPTTEQTAPPHYAEAWLICPAAPFPGATLQVLNAAGTVLTAVQSDTNGSFTIPGLSAGEHHLVISHAGFETKEVPLTVEASETSATLRITLALSGVSTTI